MSNTIIVGPGRTEKNVPAPFKYPESAPISQECMYLDKILQRLESILATLQSSGIPGEWVKVLGELTQYTVPVGKKLLEVKLFDAINVSVTVKIGTTPGGNELGEETLIQNQYHFVTINMQWVAAQIIYFSGHSSATESWLKLETLPIT